MKISRKYLLQVITEEAAKATKKYNDSDALKGDQDELPDDLQRGIIDKKYQEDVKGESKIRFTKKQLMTILEEEMDALVQKEVPDAETEEEIEVTPEDLIGIVQGVVQDVAAEVEEEPKVMGHGGTAEMAKSQLFQLAQDAQSLHDKLADEDEIPEWAQAQIAVASDDIETVSSHLDYKIHQQESSDSPAIAEQKRKIRRLLRKKTRG